MARNSLLFAVLLAVGLAGCGSSTPEKKVEKEPSETAKPESGANTEASKGSEKTKDEPAKAFALGDMIKPFVPPSLEALNAKVQWVDRPVVDPAPLLRERQAKEKQLASVEEALKLHNDSPQNNEKILSALGRLPSEEGKEVNLKLGGGIDSNNGLFGQVSLSMANFAVTDMPSNLWSTPLCGPIPRLDARACSSTGASPRT